MQPDMLLLVERIAVAMEAMSQDVKNLSSYVRDISCSVSHFQNEKRGDEGDNLTLGTPAVRPETAVKSEYSWQCEQAGECSVSHTDNVENEKASFGDVASMSVDHNETLDVSSSYTEEIKTEGQSEGEENCESCDMHDTYDNGNDNVIISRKTESQTLSESEREGHLFGVPTNLNSPDVQLKPSGLIETGEYTSVPVPQEIQRMETFSHSSVNCILQRTGLPTGGDNYSGLSSTSDSTEMIKNEINTSEYPFPLRDETTVHFPVAPPGDKDGASHVTRYLGDENTISGTRQMGSADKLSAGGTSFQCAVYNRTSATGSSLMNQMREHSEERPYKCPFCEKSFKGSKDVERHVRVHSGEKPFRCTECGKAFTQSNNLTTHMRSHTGEKPYVCSVCGKAFSVKGNLNNHMRVHTGEKPYQCTVCEKAFSHYNSLTVHLRVHSGDRPFACQNCGSRFTTSGNLRCHWLLVHGATGPVSQGNE